MKFLVPLKFIYSEKATTFCDISTGDLSYVAKVKSTVEILQDFVAFSEYMNFIIFIYFKNKICITGEDLWKLLDLSRNFASVPKDPIQFVYPLSRL